MLMKCWWQFFDTYYWQAEYSVRSASMNKQEWVEDINAEGNLSCSNQNTWSFKASVKWARQVTTVTILVFKKADLALFRDLFGIKDKGTQKKLADFQGQPLQSTRVVISNIQEAKQVWQEWRKMVAESDYLEKGRHCLSIQGYRHEKSKNSWSQN